MSASRPSFEDRVRVAVDAAVERDGAAATEADLQGRLPDCEDVGRVHEALAYLRFQYEDQL